MDQLTRTTPGQNGTSAGHRLPGKGGKRIYWIAAAAVVLLGLGLGYALRPKSGPQIVTAPVERKTLVAAVTATGTVNPQDTISVGTQVSGTIQTIYADYNDRVRAGQVLARLDPTLFQAALDQARGSLAQAQAQWESANSNARGATSTAVAAYANAAAAVQNVAVAQAAIQSADTAVDKARAAFILAQQTLQRDRQLLSAGFIAQSQYDTDSSNLVAAQSGLASAVVTARQARMQLGAAKSQSTAGAAQGSAAASQATGFAKTAAADLAAIAAAQAQVQQAQVNLAHTIITSPVDGTVIARNVSVGQTVAASFQTPTLYTIAKDLAKMEIDLAVGEPDVGGVRTGQAVNFSVLAYPNDTFVGTVAQVRENPTTIQNVVTYDTVVYENNSDGRLRPGMTANASIEVAHTDDALVVPVGALSFRLPTQQRPRTAASAGPRPSPQSAWGNTGAAQTTALTQGSLAQVTVVDHNNLSVVPVRILLVSAGEAAVEPLRGNLNPGTAVAVSVSTQGNQVVQRAPGMFR